MARRKKALSRLTRAKNLLAKVVTNRAAGLVLPVVSKTISIQVQQGDQCEIGSYEKRGYYVSEIVDPSIKADIDELHNSMLLQKVGSRRESTVVFNTMSTDDSSLLKDYRKALKIDKKIQIDGGRNQLKKTELSDADSKVKILIDRIEKHLQIQIIAELKVKVPYNKRRMAVSLLETQPPVQYTELVDGNSITKFDSVCMNMLMLCFLVLILNPLGTRPDSPS
jgi:hypothetical protein